MKKVFLTTVISISSFCMLHAQLSKADEQAIKNVLTTIQTGWNEKSGEKFASVFADVHDYIVVNGLYFKATTRERIGKIHQGLFDGVFKNTTLLLKPDHIQYLGKDLVQLTAMGSNYPSDQAVPKDPGAIMTLLIERKPEGWRIISFHNHGLEIEMIKKANVMPLEVMYASWYKN